MAIEIQVQVTNRTAYLVSEFDPQELDQFWSYSHPKAVWIMRAKPWLSKTWDGREHFLRGNELPAGLFWATRRDIEKDLNIKFRVQGELEKAELASNGILTSDREYQNECISAMLRSIRFGGGLVLGATGTGKTRMAAMLFSRLKFNTLFVVDQILLMEQAIEEIREALGETIGRVGDSDFRPERITVATRQTLYAHRNNPEFRKWTKTLNVMLIDELHEQMNHSNFKVVQDIEPLAVFGLTATLALKKKETRLKAHALCGPVVYEYPLLRGQAEGYLAKGVAIRVLYANPVSTEAQKVKGWAKLYNECIVENSERNHLIAELVKGCHQRGKYIVVLVTRVRHLKLLSDRLKEIPHRIVSGTFKGQHIKIEDRLLAKYQFESGDVRLIIANTVFKKGVNMKRVDVIIDADAGRNENDPVQKFGRGVRKHEEKVGLLHFDISDFDRDNGGNWFHIASRYRTRALQRAGIKVFKQRWESNTEAIINNAEQWLLEVVNPKKERL